MKIARWRLRRGSRPDTGLEAVRRVVPTEQLALRLAARWDDVENPAPC